MHPAPLRLLPDVELQVMRRDGVVVRFGHACAVAYASVADRLTPGDRAASLAPLVMGTAAVGGASAVWVHAGGPAPSELTISTQRGARPPRQHLVGVRYRSTAPPDAAVRLVGGVRVVVPWLALFDLLHDPTADQATIELAVRRLELDPVELLATHVTLRRPFAALARRRATLATAATGS
ncbi:hypothetical protein [Pseudoclavibacter sp. RFBB5]|uniref:hypothetical protein n=1 Tax=Pseudoclavibacter sp. RFBB5 TaxID=2080574 RepID=UPI0015E23DD8|nr:hypothetical protein [Pseudoclavibacter sp. RFBB5]